VVAERPEQPKLEDGKGDHRDDDERYQHRLASFGCRGCLDGVEVKAEFARLGAWLKWGEDSICQRPVMS
jgi:hypothetical protein